MTTRDLPKHRGQEEEYLLCMGRNFDFDGINFTQVSLENVSFFIDWQFYSFFSLRALIALRLIVVSVCLSVSRRKNCQSPDICLSALLISLASCAFHVAKKKRGRFNFSAKNFSAWLSPLYRFSNSVYRTGENLEGKQSVNVILPMCHSPSLGSR